MPRLPIAIAFVAGLACATLLGAAVPRGKPITWEYQLLDVQQELVKLRAAADARLATTRASFPDDNHARSAATLAVEDAWMAQLAGDGWLLLGEFTPAHVTGRVYVAARPTRDARCVMTRDRSPIDARTIDDALTAFDARWKEFNRAAMDREIDDGPISSTKLNQMRWDLYRELLSAELNRGGAKGVLAVPWSRDASPNRFFAASIVSE